jgi:amidase
MKRREFIGASVAGGGLALLNPLASCSQTGHPESPADYASFELNELTVDLLQDKVRSGEFSYEQITAKYIDRINLVDSAGPGLKSVIEINPDAIESARKMDDERKNGMIRGPLHGVPILIKDNIDTADQMQTTAGSLALAGFHAPKDAFIVGKLREAGAVLLGKANLSEWANIRSTRSSSGWSGRGGQVKNPYDPTRSPCGSSSGSGVAVAANLCMMAIGTETDGSIVCPSGINGIVGIKPTLGLWSRSGIIPISHSQDTPGPMARTVKDAAIFLAALSGPDPEDEATRHLPAGYNDQYLKDLNAGALQGVRIGVIRDFMGFHSEVDKVMEENFELIRGLGATLVDVKCAGDRSKWNEAEWLVLKYELKADMNKYLGERPSAPARTLKDLIDFNEAHREEEMPWFGQEFFLMADEKGGLEEKEYLDALATSKSLTRNMIDKTLVEQNVQALIMPTNAPAWKIDLINGDHYIGGTSDLAAISGYPSITVPAGQVHGLPVGLSFVGKAWDEATLIRLAYAYEQGSMKRFIPEFKPI